MLFKMCLFDTFWAVLVSGSKTACFTCFYIGAGGPEIAKSREMAWGRHSIQFPKHSAMPGGCLKKSFGKQLMNQLMSQLMSQ